MATPNTCDRCGQNNRAAVRFCTGCGGPLAPPATTAGGLTAMTMPAADLPPLAVVDDILRSLSAPPHAGESPAPPSIRPVASDYDAAAEPSQASATGSLAPTGAATTERDDRTRSRDRADTPSAPRGDRSPVAGVLGPVNRVTFQEEQARRRRRTWRLTVVCAAGAALTGIPASLVFTPALLTVLLLLTKLVDLTIGVPASVWDGYERVLVPVITAINAVDSESGTPIPIAAIVQAALVWILPGMAAMLLIWPALRALLLRGGAGGALLALGARPPRLDDFEERQLVNIVEEMAIAAGLPPPKVMLLDSPVANAAAIGSSPQDATILVSRRLLDELDRDETQGILGHLVGSVGNGDLGIALSIIAVYQTYSFVYALLKAPFSPLARATLFRLARWLVVFWGHRAHDTESAIVCQMLTRGMWDSEEQDDFARGLEERPDAPQPGVIRLVPYAPVAFIGILLLSVFTRNADLIRLLWLIPVGIAILVLLDLRYVIYAGGRALVIGRMIVSLPYYLGTFMSQFLLYFLSWLLLGPMLALMWRTRRYLADATAVQLTRLPDGLARGLLALGRSGGLVPGGAWATPLFVIGDGVVNSQSAAAHAEARHHATVLRAAMAGDQSALEQLQQQAPPPVEQGGSFSGEPASMLSLHPSISRRIKRLRALGANVDHRTARRAMIDWQQVRAGGPVRVLAMVVGLALLPVAAVLMVVVMAIMLAFTLGAGAIMMAVVYGLLQLLRG